MQVGRYINFSMLRKTFATRLVASGLSPSIVAQAMGHRSIETTEQYYINENEESILKMVRNSINL
ncbi:site-specific integrase [Planctomycetota bacterium]